MMASGWLRSAWDRPISAVEAVWTRYPSRRSIRANVVVTPSSSSTMRMEAVVGSDLTAGTSPIVTDQVAYAEEGGRIYVRLRGLILMIQLYSGQSVFSPVDLLPGWV